MLLKDEIKIGFCEGYIHSFIHLHPSLYPGEYTAGALSRNIKCEAEIHPGWHASLLQGCVMHLTESCHVLLGLTFPC